MLMGWCVCLALLAIDPSQSQSLSDVLMPQQDTLANRVVSMIASRMFREDVAPQLNDVRFYLWTRYNPNTGMRLLLNRPDMLTSALYNRLNPVKVLIHGFGGNGTTDGFATKARRAYLTLGDFNVITVDWKSLARVPNYARAALSTTPVGIFVAQFLDFLISEGTPPSAIHLIGYSLGAHVAGSAGHNVKLGRLARITGLEPASGGYEKLQKLRSLRSTDALYVDVIHTNAHVLGLGATEALGTADFYPNGGHWQYGCLWDRNSFYDSLIHCSHGRATDYFIESILAGPGKFLALRCDTFLQFTIGACGGCTHSPENCASMGEFAQLTKASGVYFLRTNPSPPYSL